MESKSPYEELLEVALRDVIFEYQLSAKDFVSYCRGEDVRKHELLSPRYHFNYPERNIEICYLCDFYFEKEPRFLGYSANLFDNNIIVSKAPSANENETFLELLQTENVKTIIRLDSADPDHSFYEVTNQHQDDKFRSEINEVIWISDDINGISMEITGNAGSHTCELFDIHVDDNTHFIFSAAGLIGLFRLSDRIKSSGAEKTLIHCASGLGRAATLNFIFQVMLDNQLSAIKKPNDAQDMKLLGEYFRQKISDLRKKRYSIHMQSQYCSAILTVLALVQLEFYLAEGDELNSAALKAEKWQIDKLPYFGLKDKRTHFTDKSDVVLYNTANSWQPQ